MLFRSWTTTGTRELHGVSHEETTIRLQLRCHSCKHSHGGSENSPAGIVEMVVDGGETEGLAASSELNKDSDVKDGGYCFALCNKSHLLEGMGPLGDPR